MQQIISKEEIEKLINIEGKVRGMALKTESDFILKEKGEAGLKKLEQTIADLGYPIKYGEIKTMNFYPLGLVAVTLLCSKNIFGFDDEKFREMGVFESKISLIIRIFMKYFVSVGTLVKQVSNVWKKYNTTGELEVAEYNKTGRYVVLRLRNFTLHPLHCLTLKGYFSNILQMVVGKETYCEETKCFHKGDSYHEFILKW